MKKIPVIFSALLLALMSSCSDDEPATTAAGNDGENTGTESPAPSEVVSNGEVCQLKTADLTSDIPDYMRGQVETRFTNVSQTIDASTHIVLVSTSALSSHDAAIFDAYQNGATIVFIDADKATALQWLDNHDIEYAGDRSDFDDLHLIYAFNNRHRYLLFDDFVDDGSEEELEMLPVRFDSAIAWLNRYADDADAVTDNAPAAFSRSGDVYDIARTFGRQVITHSFAVSMNKKVSTGILGGDTLYKTSAIDVTLVIYPLYSIKANGTSAGDYYIVDGYVNAHNAGMYNGTWTNWHGGIPSHLCAYYMSKLNFTAEITTPGLNVTFPVGGTPVPQTTASSTTYSSGFSWSISGSLTGKFGNAGMVEGDLGISGSFGWNNSQTRVLKDVEIERDTYGGKVHWTYTFNNLPYAKGFIGYVDIPKLAISDFESDYTWIWWIPDSKNYEDKADKLQPTYSATITIEPEYTGYYWYNTYVQFGTNKWSDGITDKEKAFTFKLIPPQRVSSTQK